MNRFDGHRHHRDNIIYLQVVETSSSALLTWMVVDGGLSILSAAKLWRSKESFPFQVLIHSSVELKYIVAAF